MSVINKMLKDLDQRQGDSQNAEQPEINSNYVPSVKTKPNWLLVIMLLILVALVVIGWQLFVTNSQQTTSDQAGIVQPLDAAIDKHTLANAKALNAELQQEPAAMKSTMQTLPAAESSTLNQQTAQGAVANVAVNQPDDAASVDIRDRRAESTAVQKLVSPVAEVHAPKVNQTAETHQRSSEAAAVAKRQDTPNESQIVIANKRANQPQASNQSLTSQQNTAHKNDETKGQFVIERSNASLTPRQRVEKLLASAKKSFDKGYISDGITQLEQLLTMSDGHIEARNLLAGAWYGRGESNRAVSILNNGLQRYPNVEMWRLTAAKIFFKENNPTGALSYLDVQISDASKEFLTMKGSLGRQTQQFDKSEQAYQQLTQLEPQVGNWWLGLAIAQDSQGKTEEALLSYQTLLQKGGVSNDSMAFAQQRITELKG